MENFNNASNKNYFKKTLLFSFFVFFATLSFWFGFTIGKRENLSNKFIPVKEAVFINQQEKNSSIDFSLFWEAFKILKQKYIEADNLDANKILYGAIKGMLQSTGDPYTVFFDPEENKEFEQDISGSFEGIGAEIGLRQGVITVIAPLEGSPAEKAGLRAGDKIIKIDGEITSDMSLDKAVKKMRGKKNTEVVLTIWRNSEEETKEIKIIRDLINVKSVSYEIKDENIAYIKITRFAEDTFDEFKKAVDNLFKQKPQGLVLDLRNNPGGYLDTAINIANKMIPKNSVILIEENKEKQKESIISRGGDILSEYRTVVLINEGSASASEILAAALKENRENVTLVGKKSYGKGSVQEFVDLPYQTADKITVARWLTPKGNQINEIGINPDLEINLSVDDYDNNLDPQLDKALEIIKESAE